jgi:hypothetical protein
MFGSDFPNEVAPGIDAIRNADFLQSATRDFIGGNYQVVSVVSVAIAAASRLMSHLNRGWRPAIAA